MSGVFALGYETILMPKAPDQSTPKKEDDRSAPKKGSAQSQLPQDLGLTPPEALSTFDNLSTLDYIEADTPQAWAQALQEIEAAGICGLDLETTGLDPLSSRARLCQLSLPSGRVYVADLWELVRAGASPLQDLGQLSERSDIKKVIHNAKLTSPLSRPPAPIGSGSAISLIRCWPPRFAGPVTMT